MHDAETGNWIVYDGETYNFRELRDTLQDEGVRFVGQSDTEVLLKAFGRWGEKCLGELRGMFAFAIWDAEKSRCCWAAIRWALSRSTIVPRANISCLLRSCARCSAQD